MSYITSQVIEYFMMLFNERKLIFIISNNPRQIADEIMNKLNRGATFLKGEGAYSGLKKDIIMTVANNFVITLFNASQQLNNDAARAFVKLDFSQTTGLTTQFNMDYTNGTSQTTANLMNTSSQLQD